MTQTSLKTRMAVAATLLGLSGWVSPAFSRSVKQTTVPTSADATTTAHAATSPPGITVKVDGMTCNSCVNKVKKEMAALSSGKYKGKDLKFEVVLTEVRANIGKMTSAQMTPQEIDDLRKDVAAAVTKAGYTPLLTDKSS